MNNNLRNKDDDLNAQRVTPVALITQPDIQNQQS